MADVKEVGTERAEVELIAQLMQRMAARKHPITAAQVHRFMRYPAGPILPDLCREVRKLPDEFRAQKHTLSTICALSVNPLGEPVMVTIVDNHYTFVCGDKQHRYERLHDSSPVHAWYPTILGFGGVTSEPIIAFNETRHIDELGQCSVEELDLDWKTVVYKGETQPFDLKAVHGITVLANGSLVYARRMKDDSGLHDQFEIVGVHPSTPGSEVVMGTVRAETVRGFFEDNDGHVYCIYDYKNVGYEGGKPLGTDVVVALVNNGVHETYRFAGDAFRWIGEFDGLLCAVVDNDGDRPRMLSIGVTHHDGTFVEEIKKLGTVSFRGNLTKLKDCRDAWIGVVRDFLPSWIVDGEPQPSFEQVSPIFYRDGKPHYYGVIGRHLYTMALPLLKKLHTV